VTLVDGERREVLSVDRLYAGASRDPDWKKDRHCDCEVLFDHAYFVPLGDTSWPDSMRVELEYKPPPKPAQPQPGPHSHLTIGESTKADALALLGEGVVVDFPSGYEVWVYREPEVVLLFEPSGILTKTRVR